MANCSVCAELDNLMVATETIVGSDIHVFKGSLYPRDHPYVRRCPDRFARWLDGAEGIARTLQAGLAASLRP